MELLNAYMKMIRYKTPITFIKQLTIAWPPWIHAVIGAVATFFAPEAYTFGLVLFAVLADAVFGIAVSVRNGKFALSKLGRVTVFKIFSYGAALVMVYMVERLAHDNGFFGIKVAAGWAVACEFWSMSASILIIWPDAYFFRIMRLHLRGEMQAKLGTDLDAIIPPDKPVTT